MKASVSWGAGMSITYTAQTGPFVGEPPASLRREVPSFAEFFSQWRSEKLPEWRSLHRDGVDQIARAHLLPWFGDQVVSDITREEVLRFRAHIATLPGTKGKTLSASRINKVMVILKQVLSEAAERYRFADPTKNLRKLKAPRPTVEPFTVDQVWEICDAVGEHYRDYMLCRFLTGMRTGEINGLRWSRIHLDRSIIEVRETFSAGRSEDHAKSLYSIRDIPMLPPVRDMFLRRREHCFKRAGDYVFTSPRGGPIDAKNFTNRVFYPALDRLGISRRRPYQTRHTTATLLLAAGENPEWVARILGHADTTMLHSVYSRYVPNLTRRDGSAVSALLADQVAARQGVRVEGD